MHCSTCKCAQHDHCCRRAVKLHSFILVTAVILLVIEFMRALICLMGMLFHSSTRALVNWARTCLSTWAHRCSIGDKSGLYGEHCDPRDGASFFTQGCMYKPGRSQQGDAAYQISKLYVFQFQRKRTLKMNFYVPTCDRRGCTNFDPMGII